MIDTVLLIDDDDDVQIYVEYIVKKIGKISNFKTAKDGFEGLEYLKNNPAPTMILLDINMPRMNGWEFLEEYKKLNIGGSILVCMLTVSVNPDDKRKAEDMGIQFINKPLTPEKLVEVIETNFPNEKTG